MRIIKTIFNIGPRLIFKRFIYEIQRLLDKKILYKLNYLYLDNPKRKPKWDTVDLKNNLPYLKSKNISKKDFIEFNFLNERKKLKIPFKWNNSKWSRLWQFNLHYFDWSREYLEKTIRNGQWPKEAKYLESLIDLWIDGNHLGFGDGWHSYTISLRARNWIWLFIFYPKLKNKKRLESLWDQLCWLDSHPEQSVSPNHWLENLITLVIGSLNFEGQKSSKIYIKNIKKLEKALDYQVLPDGGHIERSASYHILILDRLIELAFVIEYKKGVNFIWLNNKILSMTKWANNIRLTNGNIPRFNDSPLNGAPNIDIVISFAENYLNNKNNNLKGLRLLISKLRRKFFKNKLVNIKKTHGNLCVLKDTGWSIIRLGNVWEICIKWGKPCCKEYPGHGHSDLISFDIFLKGKPLLVETGTSLYQNNDTRKYERSGKAHNILQISNNLNISNNSDSQWAEPIEVWGSFRVAKIAKIIKFEYGIDDSDYIWNSSSHDGFKKFKLSYKRQIKFKLLENGNLKMKLNDTLDAKRNFKWRQNWHEGPDLNSIILDKIIKQTKVNLKNEFKHTKENKWISDGFGQREQRRSLFISGILPKGTNNLKLSIDIEKDLFDK